MDEIQPVETRTDVAAMATVDAVAGVVFFAVAIVAFYVVLPVAVALTLALLFGRGRRQRLAELRAFPGEFRTEWRRLKRAP